MKSIEALARLGVSGLETALCTIAAFQEAFHHLQLPVNVDLPIDFEHINWIFLNPSQAIDKPRRYCAESLCHCMVVLQECPDLAE